MTDKEYYLANRAKIIAHSKAYYLSHKEHCLALKKKWAKQNPDKRREHLKRSAIKHADKIAVYFKEYNRRPEVLARHRLWKKEHRAQLNSYLAKRPPMDRVYHSMRQRVRNILNRPCNGSLFKFIGCTAEFLREHLEKQFKPGMTWDNYGVTGWHIDHVKPITAFDLTDPEQKSTACHWTNLQPLWYWENIAKGDKAA